MPWLQESTKRGWGRIRLNLYEMIFEDDNEYKSLSHGKKAGRRAPYWAAEINQMIHQVLSESSSIQWAQSENQVPNNDQLMSAPLLWPH